MPTVSRPRGSFGVDKKNVPGVLVRAKTMYSAILAAIALFQNPTVALPVFLGLIQALEAAQQAASTRAKGLAKVRDTKRNELWTAMESLRAYVQGLADAMTADHAAALIESGGLLVAQAALRSKPVLAATLTTTPGLVHLVANAKVLVGTSSARVAFHWQWSADGKSWSSVISTPYANTDVAGLSLMATYSFRVAVTVGREIGEWSQPVSLLVH